MRNIDDRVVSPEQIVAKKTIFIWIDILGFTEALEDEGSFEELALKLQDFRDAFTTLDNCSTAIISDGLLIRIIDPTYDTTIRVFEEIGKLQYKFIMKHQMFLRGGISIGKKLENGDDGVIDIVSQGLARAAKFEGAGVDWPIIATNEKYIKEISEHITGGNEEVFSLIPTYNRKGEKIYFIEFLFEPNDAYYRLINNMCQNFLDKPSIHSKYVWLLRHYFHKFPETERKIELIPLETIL